jgi:hypothetical protein
MKFIHLVAAAALSAAAPAFAAPVTIDFEGAESFASVGEKYAAQGVHFSGPALAFANDELSAPLQNLPSGTTVMFTAPDGPATVNVDAGFFDKISFLYSSASGGPSSSTTITVYDGANGTGNVIASGSFGNNTDTIWDTWSLFSLSLNGGVGKSISFGDASGYVAFDNVTVNAVPLPAALLLFPFGAAGLGFVARRKKALAAA